MRFFAFTSVVALLALPAVRSQDMGTPMNVSVSFDQTYDNGSNSMDLVACSDGINGLITRSASAPPPLSPQQLTLCHLPPLLPPARALCRRVDDLRAGVGVPEHRGVVRRRGLRLAELRDVLAAVLRGDEQDAERARDRHRPPGVQHRARGDGRADEQRVRRPWARRDDRRAGRRDRVRAGGCEEAPTERAS